MTHTALLLLALALPGADDAKKEEKKPVAPPAKAVVVGELACLHCTFGVGDGCCTSIKIDDKTPVKLVGKDLDEFEKQRFSKKVVVAEGTLSFNKKDKVIELAVEKVRFFDKEKDKGLPEAGMARIVGKSACGKCDLNLTEDCQAALRNGEFTILLDGKLAEGCQTEGKTYTATGKLSVDKNNIIRLDTKTLDKGKDEPEKKEEKKDK